MATLSVSEERDLYYATKLTFGEITAKVSYESAQLTINKIRPYLDRINIARMRKDERMARRAAREVVRIVARDAQNFKRNTLGGLSKLSLWSNRAAYRLGKDVPPLRAKKRTAGEQLAMTNKETLLQGRPAGRRGSGQSPTRVDTVLVRSLLKDMGRVYRARDDATANRRLQGALNQFAARQTTVHRTLATHYVEQGKKEAGRERARRYVYLTQQDERVDSICKPHHGKIYRYDNPSAPVPPLHHNCRCTTEAYDEETRDLTKRLARETDYDRWLRANQDKVLDATLNYNPLERLVQGGVPRATALLKSKRLYETNKQAIAGVLRTVRNQERWVSRKSFLDTQGRLNNRQARQSLIDNAAAVGVELKLPGALTKAQTAKRLSNIAGAYVYGE